MSHWREFDYVVVNDRFEEALSELAAIVSGYGAPHRSGEPSIASAAEAILAS